MVKFIRSLFYAPNKHLQKLDMGSEFVLDPQNNITVDQNYDKAIDNQTEEISDADLARYFPYLYFLILLLAMIGLLQVGIS